MPRSILDSRRVQSMLPTPLGDDELRERLFASKAELSEIVGSEWTVEVTPDRLDLLSEGGLGSYLQGVTDSAHGLVPMPTPAQPRAVRVIVDPAVHAIRPSIAAAVVHAPPGQSLDPGLLLEAIRFQEILHATVGLDRRLASIGIYPLDRVTPPILYRLEPVDQRPFSPLEGTGAVGLDQFFESHPMALR
ncbi:MAG: hypothetical protein L3K08_08130, partial [Thermoplasmata archaeon]|nr:hypothetical protein [Thermoplasmata archaeon]